MNINPYICTQQIVERALALRGRHTLLLSCEEALSKSKKKLDYYFF
jgi:hypothetical protein